jgi:hypothetical protein
MTKHRLKRLFAEHGLEVHSVRHGRHHVCTVSRNGGVPITKSPSGWKFPHRVAQSLRRAEREARQAS